MARSTISERVYRLLLRFYPGEFRDDYEREMMLAFRERLSHDRGVGLGAVLRLWFQLLSDSLLRAPRVHADVLRQDVRYALRSMRRSPAFTLTAVAMLFEVRARDPLTIGAAVAAVAAIALLASYIPARRAAKVDPLVALRAE